MSMLNTSGEESSECPLCMELLEMDDLSFYPCTCGYQICRFCWHRIRTDENGLCPACRKAYPENPADFKPLSTQEMHRIKAEKRQKDQQKKQKATENRKHLANVRVVQRNLVFVVGLSPRLADPEVLKRHEYFGKFGKIHKVVINHSTQYAGSQGPSASAYVTYVRGEDALRAIQMVNNISVDGRTLRASLGTTKYCSHFMKNQSCPKPDCMYLHEIGDEAASFTKEEMQQGKHTDYERLLHEQLFIYQNHKEGRKTSSSPLLQGNSSTTQSGTRDAWPSLPPGSTNSSATPSLNSSGKGGSMGSTATTATVKGEPVAGKEKSSRSKNKSQSVSAATQNGVGGANEESKSNGTSSATSSSSRKAKEKSVNSNGGGSSSSSTSSNGVNNSSTIVQSQPTNSKGGRQRSTSRSPVLSTSSNPTPPPTSSSPSSSVTGEHGGFPSALTQTQQQILEQGASLAAEEEEIDRVRDEAEDLVTSDDSRIQTPHKPVAVVPMSSPPPSSHAAGFGHSHAYSLAESSNNSSNHSFFSTGPLPAYTARSTGSTPSGCWLANGAEEGSMTSSLPNQSASDWQSALTDLTSCSQLGSTNLAAIEAAASKAAEDDLGFDPFHETQKALAEMLEKESISNGGAPYGNSVSSSGHHLGFSSAPSHVQSLYSAPSAPHLTRHSPNQFSLGLGLGLGVGVGSMGAHHPQPTRTRIPPPGFNPAQMGGPMSSQQAVGSNSFGLSLPNLVSNRPVTRGGVDMGSSKMLPFMNSNSHSNSGASNGSSGLSALGPRLFGETPSQTLGMSAMNSGGMGLGMGMAINNMGYNNMAAQNGSLGHMSASKTHQGFNMGLGSNLSSYNGSSNTSSHHGNSNSLALGDPTSGNMKDWQEGFRVLFPNANISMGSNGIGGMGMGANNLSGLSHANRMGAFPPGMSGSGLAGGQQPQQPHVMQQPNPLGLTGKGWTRNSLSDWTCLDPAIVSSGQISDSRSDSPPHWLRSLEQLTESSPAQPAGTATNHNASNGLFGLNSSASSTSHYSTMPSLGPRNSAMAAGFDGSASMGSFWPPSVSHSTPSMPPPGFSHIRPSSKTADTQKIDSDAILLGTGSDTTVI